MRFIRAIWLLAPAATLSSCSGTGLDAARDLTGTWEGNGPNGAIYADNVANPNCECEADVRIVFVQDGTSLTGSYTLTVTTSTELISTSLPCVPVGSSNNEALFGSVNSSNVNFEAVREPNRVLRYLHVGHSQRHVRLHHSRRDCRKHDGTECSNGRRDPDAVPGTQ